MTIKTRLEDILTKNPIASGIATGVSTLLALMGHQYEEIAHYGLDHKTDIWDILINLGLPITLGVATTFLGKNIKETRERKKSEQRLKESEERSRTFFENAPEYCYMVSSDGKILDINKSALSTLGYTKEDIIGKSLVATIYSSSSQEKAKKLLRQWRETGQLRNEELNIVTKQ